MESSRKRCSANFTSSAKAAEENRSLPISPTTLGAFARDAKGWAAFGLSRRRRSQLRANECLKSFQMPPFQTHRISSYPRCTLGRQNKGPGGIVARPIEPDRGGIVDARAPCRPNSLRFGSGIRTRERARCPVPRADAVRGRRVCRAPRAAWVHRSPAESLDRPGGKDEARVAAEARVAEAPREAGENGMRRVFRSHANIAGSEAQGTQANAPVSPCPSKTHPAACICWKTSGLVV